MDERLIIELVAIVTRVISNLQATAPPHLHLSPVQIAPQSLQNPIIESAQD